MRLILPFNGHTPKIHESAFVAENATIIGDVTIGPDSSVFYGAVLRADTNSITIGARTNIQDNCVLHVDHDAPVVLGDDVTVGHMALVHGTTVHDGALIGMSSSLLSGSIIGEGALVAAGAVVLEGQEIPAKSMAAGVPATVRKEIDAEFVTHAGRYVELARKHKEI